MTSNKETESLWVVINEWHGGDVSRAIDHVLSGQRMAIKRCDYKLAKRLELDLRILHRMKKNDKQS